MNFRLVVLDMAGTTVRDEGLVAEALLGAIGAEHVDVARSAAQALMGYTKPEAIRRLLTDVGADADAARVARIHADFIARMVDTYRHDARVAAIDGAEETFDVLHRAGVRVALNTAFAREIADTIVTRLGWAASGAVDAVICAEEVEEGRPAPDMIQALMSKFDVDDPRDVVKVGDTEVDIREGRNAGCGLVVAVTTGAFTREALAAYAPDQTIDHLDQLMPLMQRFRAPGTQ